MKHNLISSIFLTIKHCESKMTERIFCFKQSSKLRHIQNPIKFHKMLRFFTVNVNNIKYLFELCPINIDDFVL